MLTKEELKNWETMVPKALTLSAVRYFQEQDRVESLRWYLTGADYLLKKHIDEVRSKFQGIFQSLLHPISEHLSKTVQDKENAERIFNIDTYEAVLGHALLSRSVDNFSTYLKDLLYEVALAKPQILKSAEKEPIDYILSFNNMEELAAAIAEKRIEGLFYGGIEDVAKYFESRLGVEIFDTTEHLDEVKYCFRVRNLIVHNRGRLTKEFINDFPSNAYEEGAMLLFDLQAVSRYNLFFQRVLVRLDDMIAKKFSLSTYSNYPHLDPRLKNFIQRVVVHK